MPVFNPSYPPAPPTHTHTQLLMLTQVDNRGVSGEKVIDSMVDRLDRILSEEGKQYDWVLILGGSNNLR